MKRDSAIIFLILLAGLVLSACQAVSTQTATTIQLPEAVQQSTETVSPTLTPQPTSTSEPTATAGPILFDGQRAYDDVVQQVDLGPRIPGTAAHDQAVEAIQDELKDANWETEIQSTSRLDHPIQNIIAKRGNGTPWIIIGAHYDSRMVADHDPDLSKQKEPVPGANDGASGVGVLLELARVLPKDLNKQVWLVFFDAEDQGELPGWDWILGSRAFAEELEGTPNAVIVIDMIGDANLNIYQERNSDPGLTAEIWQVAKESGYEQQFIPQPKFSMLDDHTPFLEKGLKAIDIIDFNYPYYHTTDDTSDKVSPQSLEAVGRTLQYWLVEP